MPLTKILNVHGCLRVHFMNLHIWRKKSFFLFCYFLARNAFDTVDLNSMSFSTKWFFPSHRSCSILKFHFSCDKINTKSSVWVDISFSSSKNVSVEFWKCQPYIQQSKNHIYRISITLSDVLPVFVDGCGFTNFNFIFFFRALCVCLIIVSFSKCLWSCFSFDS